jgi:hypothetical protein
MHHFTAHHGTVGMKRRLGRRFVPTVPERLMPRVRQGRYVLLPTTEQTRRHGTHSLPAIWEGELAAFLQTLPQR